VGEDLGREDHARDSARHVAGAAPVHGAVRDDGVEWRMVPGVEWEHVDDVDVAVEQQGASAAGAGEARDELGPPLEGEAVGDHRVSRDERGIGLRDVDRGAGGLQPRGEVCLERSLLPRGCAGDVRRRVEADQGLQQLDELLLAVADRRADALFERGELLDLQTELHLEGKRSHNATVNPGTAALARGLSVLCALADDPSASGGLGVVALAELVGGDKSQLSRTLRTLEEHGFVERDADTLAYRLGWRLFAVAARVGESQLLAAAPPVLRGLVRELGESVHLSVRQGDQVLTLLSESPAATLHAPGRVGGLTPLASTSAGRVLAFDLDAAELKELSLAGYAAEIASARALGYAIVREEFEPGLVAAAAPIRDGAGRVVAALNVSAPRFRFEDRLDEAASRVLEAAGVLSAAIGGKTAVAS
jgi:IclR family KDG regulon transcriptional repressor